MSGRLPDFLIVGAARSGTTSLARYLSLHPELRVHPKEIHFFSRKFEQGLEWYRAHFSGPWSHGEKSPTYLWYRSCHERLKNALPEARLIAILREPVARAYSNWNYRHQKGWLHGQTLRLNARRLGPPLERQDFAGVSSYYLKQGESCPYLGKRPLDLIDRGRYAEQLEHLLRYYPRQQLLVLIFERFFADVAAGLQAVHRFLRVDPVIPPEAELLRHNQRSYRAPLPEGVVSPLREFYQPHNERLLDLLGYEIKEWRQTQ